MVQDFERFRGEPLLKLASLMDHTPGQRQFVNIDAFKIYYKGRYKLSDAEVDDIIVAQTEDHHRNAAGNPGAPDRGLSRGRACSWPATTMRPRSMSRKPPRLGFTISEFPTTLDAANAARRHNMTTVAGAPNVVRGGSHSGNIAARRPGGRGCARCPVVRLRAGESVAQRLRAALGAGPSACPTWWPSCRAIPREMVGLEDRGEIAPGKRADLVRVRVDGKTPVVTRVWREGRQVS